MNWTRERPIGPGVYWMRNLGTGVSEAVKVCLDPQTHGLSVAWFGQAVGYGLFTTAFDNREWSGPLTPPGDEA